MCRRFQALNRAEKLSKHLDVGLTNYLNYHEWFPFWSSAFKAHSLQSKVLCESALAISVKT